MKKRNKKNANSVEQIYTQEIVFSGYYYLHQILDEFDVSKKFDSNLLKLIDSPTLLEIPSLFFQPIADAQELTADIEDESSRRFPITRQSCDKFHTLGKSMFSLNEMEKDLETYFEDDKEGPEKFQEFLISYTADKIQSFQLEESASYRKIEETFKALNLPIKYAKITHILFILEELNPLYVWLYDWNDEDVSFNFISKISELSRSEIVRATSAQSKLVKFGIFQENSDNSRRLFLTSIFHLFLLDEKQSTFGMRLIKEETSPSQPLESFFLPENDKNKIKFLLRSNNSAKILLYGTPGSGKTEFAKSLASELGVGLLKVDNHEAEDLEERRAALVVGELVTRGSDAVLLMDESDDLLNEGGRAGFSLFAPQPLPEKKIWMNEFLDSMQGRVIFITNMSSSIDKSVLRRFDYSIEFFPADQKQREYYWNRVLELENMNERLCDFRVKEISETYSIGVGGITTAVRSAKKILKNADTEFDPVLIDVLCKHTHLLGTKVNKPLLSKTPYDRSILHTDSDLEGLEQLISDFKNQMDNPANTNLGSLCLLFYGKPGTGKTEFVRYLAKKLEIEMIQKRSSDLQSMWLGKTETEIARAFQEAESKKGIFFLDEADSFFRNRELANTSWEGSETNEFLTWMETFRGIFIASTNFMKDFDPAALRRFAWKGEFKPLRRDDKVKILLQYFPNLTESFSALDFEDIKDIPGLTPGDFRALWNRMRFRDPKSISFLEVIDALRSEASFKSENQNKVIGF